MAGHEEIEVLNLDWNGTETLSLLMYLLKLQNLYIMLYRQDGTQLKL